MNRLIATDITYPSGRLVRYVYDGLNRVQRVSNAAQGTGYPGSGAFPAQLRHSEI